MICATAADIHQWCESGNWPDFADNMCKNILFKRLKRRVDWPAIRTLKDLMNHWYLKDILPYFVEEFREEEDLFFTGSWIRGTWRHPEHGPEDKITAATELKKRSVSDLDFWTRSVPRNEARERLIRIGNRLDVVVSWVEWPGPAIDLFGDLPSGWVGCNRFGKISRTYNFI